MRNWLAPNVETRLLDEVAQRRRRNAALRQTIRPETARLMTGYADAYPWMDPGAVQSLASSGLRPDDPAVVSIADIAAQQAAEEGEFDTPADEVADPWYETLFNAATGWAKPIVRTGFTILATPMEELEALLGSAGQALFEDSEPEQAGGGFPQVLAGLLNPLAAVQQLTPELVGAASDPADLIGDFWTNYTEKAARSTGLLALGDLVEGKYSFREWWTGRDDMLRDAEGNPVEAGLGSGFLPAGPIWQEREAQKRRLTLDGEFVTPGRVLARNFTEPGSTEYQFLSGLSDFSRQIAADPAEGALRNLSRAARATRNFQSVGLIDGLRGTVDPERAVRHFLTSREGRDLVDWLTVTDDVDDIWQATRYADLETAGRLANTSTTNETLKVLSDTLGTVIREKPTASWFSRRVGGLGQSEYGAIFGAGARVRRSTANWRWTQDMPRSLMNAHDINDSARQLDRWMRNSKLGDDVRKARIRQLAGLEDGDSIGLLDVGKGVMDDTKKLLMDIGVRESRATRLTRLYDNMGEELRAFGIDALGRHEDVLGPFRRLDGGELQVMPKAMPLLASEMVDNIIPLPPSARDIRRLTGHTETLRRLYDSGLWKGTVDGLDSAMSSIWKPLQLLRGAYTVRVIGEEQVRMAGSGLDTLFTHPFSAIAWTHGIDPKSRLGRLLARADIDLSQRGTRTVTGELMDEIHEYNAALSRGAAGHTGLPGEILTGRYVKAGPGDPDRFRGWTVELQHMANDPVMRRLAGGLEPGDLRSIGGRSTGNIVDDVKEWFWSGSGQKFRKDWARIHGREALYGNQQVADDYIDLFVNRLQNSTGGDPDLIEAVAKRRLGDLSLRDFGQESKIASLLEDSYSHAIPNYVKKPEVLTRRGRFRGFDRLTDAGFDFLMSKPTNFLSRSPTFRQKYWQRVSEVIGFADEATQKALIRAADDANMGSGFIGELAEKVVQAGPGTKLSGLDDVDVLAKGFALDETRKLLYDLQKRSQFFDMARLVFPFGEAWKEIIGAWTQILRKNPQTIRRFQQGLDGVRQPSLLPGAEPEQGLDPDSGQGFFHKDPNTGEEVFTYPAQWAGKLLGLTEPSGAGVSFVGRAAGLNIVSATVLPGFGPVVQYPASKIIPETPGWDFVEDTISPFGQEGFIESFIPSWLEKVGQGLFGDPRNPENHRLFANTVADVQRHLLASNPRAYDISTQDGQQQLFDDATSKAKWLYIIRGVAQSGVPTGPSLQWTTEDVEGNVVPVKLLSDELRRMTQEEYGGDRQAAFADWVRRFGVENVLATVGKSTAVTERPVTEKGDEWLRAHAELERDYPITIGYFAPEPAVGEFDYNAYLRQFETGAREALAPDEQVALANDFLGRIQWEQAKRVAALKPGPVTSSWLAQVRTQLAEKFPGFDGWVSRRVWEQRPQVEEQIAELERAVTTPELQQTDAGQGTILYLSARQLASQMVATLPGNTKHFQQAKSAIHIRSWLRSVAAQIVEEHPDFARVWHGVFERELAEDEELALGGGISA